VIALTPGELGGIEGLTLTDTCTLESPTNTGTGWAVVATGVPCRLVDHSGGPRASAGGLPNVLEPRVYFKKVQALAVDWLATVTSQSNRTVKVGLIVAPHAGALQYVTASGTR
jgi:hypothetical protein